MATTTLWLVKKKAPDFSEALTILLNGSAAYSLAEPPEVHNPVEKPDVIGLIPWFSLRDGAFATDLCALWKEGCRWFVLVTPSPEHPLPWASFPAHLRAAFDVAIRVCNTPSLENLRGSIDATKAAIDSAKADKSWANRRVQECVEARTLYTDLLSIYSHNSKTDVTNQFLAPARLLMFNDCGAPSKSQDEWKKVWEKPNVEGAESKTGFKIEVLDKLPGEYGSLGKELAVAAEKITEGLKDSDRFSVTDLENLMALLTGIRVSAGVRTHAGDSSGSTPQDSVKPVCAKNADTAFRVLVVDDHAASWRSVFERLQGNLAEKPFKLEVSFAFSLDGKTSWQIQDGKVEAVHFSYYDLVILDVFLGGTTGIEILKLLRRDFSQLPVLLWTTSRDEEITAEATLANGILLKKTVTLKSLISAVARWVERGKAMRTASLPNPFFNHTITNLKYRQLAVEFHEWCLKQLDSFHALDGEYFRFFTDHGGRHIVKLWELLEQALQPFLQDKDGLLLPENDTPQRELEILGLYLTVICHELGMFPMRIGEKVEDFGKLGRGYLDDVRSLHAVRGMVLLHDATKIDGKEELGQYWNDARGRQLAKRLRDDAPKMAERLAVLVGYHARVFKSMTEQAFLNWEFDDDKGKKCGARLDLAGKLSRLASPVPTLSRTDDAFSGVFGKLVQEFQAGADCTKRLRRQCALFRFVDALDITASRNPAEFLVGSGRLPAKQYGENLKRELCDSARIEDGRVRVIMKPPKPDLELVKKIIKSVPKLMKKKDRDAATAANEFLENNADAALRVSAPWSLDLPLLENDERLALLQKESALILQKPLDCWLTNVWEVLKGNGGKDAFVRELQEMGVLDGKTQEPTLILDGAKIIAQITALSIAGELLDEYQAIVEGGLSDMIRLAPIEWDGAPDWSTLPDGLTTLKSALPDEETT